MVFNKHTTLYSNCFNWKVDYLLKDVMLPKIRIPWLLVQTTGINLLIWSPVIFLNEDRNNQNLEENLVFTEGRWIIWESQNDLG